MGGRFHLCSILRERRILGRIYATNSDIADGPFSQGHNLLSGRSLLLVYLADSKNVGRFLMGWRLTKPIISGDPGSFSFLLCSHPRLHNTATCIEMVDNGGPTGASGHATPPTVNSGGFGITAQKKMGISVSQKGVDSHVRICMRAHPTSAYTDLCKYSGEINFVILSSIGPLLLTNNTPYTSDTYTKTVLYSS